MKSFQLKKRSTSQKTRLCSYRQAFRGTVKERNRKGTIPFFNDSFFSKGTELNEERGEIWVFMFGSCWVPSIYIYIVKFVHKRTKTRTILVVANVLRPLSPPFGVNHEKLHPSFFSSLSSLTVFWRSS